MSDENRRDLEDVLRDIAQEVSSSLERISELDVDGLVRSAGLDPDRGREWLDQAQRWVQDQVQAAQDMAQAAGEDAPAPAADAAPVDDTPATGPVDEAWQQAGPHPLDLPTVAQGTALAALDSGRWSIEPGTSALTVTGDGPGPSDALGLVRALRVRDWLTADGTLTLAGRRALERWLAAAA